ncbi:phage tail protein [Clostridium novyi]|uniref:phage tail protein n=1 Tax=Clostridium novyi TaxID=1542 RepID=UPI0004D8DAB1|nr:phage tail protein [Clostridium novyi]KEH84760.1 tail fiber protein [Clostridium novyi A str. BKT29909]
MAEQFYTILTAIGKAKMANTTALGTKVNLTKFQVGDGNGTYYNPTEDQTGLKHKTWEGPISSITVDENNPNWIVIEVIIPSNVGGFMIREAGVFDDEGNMIAIGKYPETYKPVASNGSTKDLIIKMILEVSNTSSVTLKVDPTVILATQKDIQTLNNRIGNIKVPVQSVNSKTGVIELKAVDIKTADGTNLEEFKKKTNSQYEEATNKISDLNTKTSSIKNDIKKIMPKNTKIEWHYIYYVDGENGSDEQGLGTKAKPFRTIRYAAAISMMFAKDYIANHTEPTIELLSDFYEYNYLNGFWGVLNGNGHNIKNISCDFCNIKIKNIKVTSQCCFKNCIIYIDEIQCVGENSTPLCFHISADRSLGCISNITLDTTYSGISADSGSSIEVSNINVQKVDICVYSSNSSLFVRGVNGNGYKTAKVTYSYGQIFCSSDLR